MEKSNTIICNKKKYFKTKKNVIINDNKLLYDQSDKELELELELDSELDSVSDSVSVSDSDSDSDSDFNTKIEKKCDNPSISTIKNMYFTRNRINLRPNYQREFTWSFEKMCIFIDSLMKGYVIPTFILYKLSQDEKKDKNIDFECVDGQHRLTVLQKFMNSELISIGMYEKYIYWEKIKKDNLNNKIKEKVFYKLTPEIKSKYKKCAREMTIDEKNFFDDTQFQFIIIQSKLNDKQKCDIFNRLQNGEKVSSINKVKNISHPITDYLRNNNIISSNIIEQWDDIIKINFTNKRSINCENNYKKDHFTYLLIRLILIYDKKSLDVNYMNLNIRKYLENNYQNTKINGDVDLIYKNIFKIKNNISKKFNGYNMIAELFIIIFHIYNIDKDKYDMLEKKSIKDIIVNYNKLEKYKLGLKDKVVSKEIMNKFYKEIIEIINKYSNS